MRVKALSHTQTLLKATEKSIVVLSETVVLGLLGVTTTIAIAAASRKKREETSTLYFGFGAILSWALLFFYLFYAPETVIVSTPNPLTAEGIQGLLILIMILVEVVGFYYWTKRQ